ncbi:hypothetical protein C0993_007271 [Termitomyces sp. T159_Od127]|nr:hypothetical protein C0993_007271 [Termitomyces sp. T159_Od127]
MVLMFEEAYKQQPTNEELGAQTFFANVRASHWKSAQQANDPATPPTMKTILYKLAHRLVTSSPTPSYQSNDRFHLHLSVLQELELYDDAHKLLDSDIGRAICTTSLSCNEIRRNIWRKRGMIVDEGKLAMQRISEKHDRNWLEFLSVLDATFSYFSPSDESISPVEGLEHVRKTKEFFVRIAGEDGAKDRSAALALLELEKRARVHGISKDSTRLVILMQDYFNRVGHKACCFEDLKPYIELGENELTDWTSFLQAVPRSFDTPEELQRLINTHKLLRYNLTQSELSVEAETARVALYIEQYLEGLKLGSNLLSTELQYADDLALLATNSLVTLWRITSNEEYLFSAVTLLEFALTKSKQSFQARLALIRLYRLLGAPSLAVDHYRAMGVKQVQNDTLSHFLLSRASTFSLASTGDLTLATECLESTQIYLSNSQETADFVVRAFQGERYSQIPEFIIFEERLDNSLQRDIVKMEYLRMRLTHEQITSDVIDMELIELKFIFDRTHYDNRDFDIMSNYQPKVSSDIFSQTNLLEKNESHGWLKTFLKVYIRAFQQGSDLDDSVEEKLLIGDRPKQSFGEDSRPPLRQRLAEPLTEEELAEVTFFENIVARSQDSFSPQLTQDELLFVQFARALAEWLELYHDYTRPPPNVVLAEAAKQTELKTGYPLKGVDLAALNRSSPTKKDEEPPAVTEPPEQVARFFETLKVRFDETRRNRSLIESLHVATLVQEVRDIRIFRPEELTGYQALLLFVVETLRFKSTVVVKANKFGALAASLKLIRGGAIEVLRDISSELVKQSEIVATQENRNTLIDACVTMTSRGVDADFLSNVTQKIIDSRKKVIEGVSKGIERICSTYSK